MLTQKQKQDLIESSLSFHQAKEVLAGISSKIHPTGIDDLIDAAYAGGKAEGMAVGEAKKQLSYDELHSIIRGFGYTTSGQSCEIAEAILKEQK